MKYEVYLSNKKTHTTVYVGSINECINYMKHNSDIFSKGFAYCVYETKPNCCPTVIPSYDALLQFDTQMFKCKDDNAKEDFINDNFLGFVLWLYDQIKDKPEIKKLRDQYIMIHEILS